MTDSSDRVAPRRGRRSSRRWVVRVLLVVLALFVIVLAYQVTRTGLALYHAKSDATQLRAELSARDLAGAERTAQDLAHQAGVAHDHSDNVLWDALAALPVVGDNVDAVQRLSAALDGVGSVVPQSLTVVRTLDQGGLRSADGRIDLGVVSGLGKPLGTLSAALTRADRHVAGIRPDQLLPGLSGQVRTALGQLHDVTVSTRAGARAVEVLPAMLGAEGRRTYLLVVQNTAETRGAGGNPGSFALLSADGGKVALEAQRSNLAYPPLKAPATPISAEERAIYGDTLATDVRDMTINPDFPTDAQRLAVLEQRDHGTRVDGVVSVDPIALASLLQATGPVEVDGIKLDGDTAVRELLNKAYQRLPSDREQNAFFAKAASAIFTTLIKGDLSTGVVGSLATSVGERRIMVWSAHDDVQSRLDGTAIAGQVSAGHAGGPQVGIYLNDGTSGKLEYYLYYGGTLAATDCTGAGAQRLHGTFVLTSNVPDDTASLPGPVAGLGGFAPRGWMRIYLQVYAPAGGRLTALEANGKKLELPVRQLGDRRVTSVPILIKPGEQVRLSMDLVGGVGDRDDAVMRWTPGMRQGPTQASALSACG